MYLWDNKAIQEMFVNDFFIKNCENYFRKKEREKVKELIEVVVNDLFLEHTSKFPEWRLVVIQQRVIEWEVKKANSLVDLSQS